MNAKEKKNNRYLSKSLFTRGLQCHKSLYLKKYHPELAEEPSDDQQARMDSGQEVGIIAQRLFPGGVEVPYEGLSYDEQLEKTREAIEAGRTIYEGAFSYDNIFIKVDILRKGPDGWDLYEVKGTTEAIAEIVLQHHERLDGSGYPQGLKNDQILLESQIIAVADVVEAMASHRPYRPALGINIALEEIGKNKGVFYDTEVVDTCLRLFRERGFGF